MEASTISSTEAPSLTSTEAARVDEAIGGEAKAAQPEAADETIAEDLSQKPSNASAMQTVIEETTGRFYSSTTFAIDFTLGRKYMMSKIVAMSRSFARTALSFPFLYIIRSARVLR